jgi:hypothetical protein
MIRPDSSKPSALGQIVDRRSIQIAGPAAGRAEEPALERLFHYGTGVWHSYPG